MIESVWKTPDPVTILKEDPINVIPGGVGSQKHQITLHKDAQPITIGVQLLLPGPGMFPEIKILPHLHIASGYPKATLDGVDYDIRQGTMDLDPGVSREFIVYIGLTKSAPWDSMFIVQIHPNMRARDEP